MDYKDHIKYENRKSETIYKPGIFRRGWIVDGRTQKWLRTLCENISEITGYDKDFLYSFYKYMLVCTYFMHVRRIPYFMSGIYSYHPEKPVDIDLLTKVDMVKFREKRKKEKKKERDKEREKKAKEKEEKKLKKEEEKAVLKSKKIKNPDLPYIIED